MINKPMPLEIVIPKGWERVTKGRMEKGDRYSEPRELVWKVIPPGWEKKYYKLLFPEPIIRKVKAKNGKQ